MMSQPVDVSRENFRIDGSLQVEGSLLPSDGNQFDLGSSTRRFRDLYLGDPLTGHVATIYFGDQTLTAEDILAVKYVATESFLTPGNVSFYEDIFDKPTTLVGYGIVDAATDEQGARGDSVYQTNLSLSAGWENCKTIVNNVSAYWPDQSTQDVWNSTNVSVNTMSSKWDSTYTDVNSTSGAWDSTYTTMQTNSAGWKDVYDNISSDTAILNNISVFGNGDISGNFNVTGNINTSGRIYGPGDFVLDPAGHDNNTGRVVIAGDLFVEGETTTINSVTLTVADKQIVLASNSPSSELSEGAGIHVNGANASMSYLNSLDSWDFNKDIRVVDPSPKIYLHNTTNGHFSIFGHDEDGGYLRVSDLYKSYTFRNAGNRTMASIDFINERLGVRITEPRVTLDLEGTDAMMVPRGANSERPEAIDESHHGYIRYNTEKKTFEGFGEGNVWQKLARLDELHDQDEDTFIRVEESFGSDDDKMVFFNKGAETMRITSDNKVGIHTGAAVNDALHVAESVTISKPMTVASIYRMLSFASDRTIDDYGGLGSSYWDINVITPINDHRIGNLQFTAKSQPDSDTMSAIVTFTNNGKVGINNPMPDQNLDVAGSTISTNYSTRGVDSYIYFDNFSSDYFIGRSAALDDSINIWSSGQLSASFKSTGVNMPGEVTMNKLTITDWSIDSVSTDLTISNSDTSLITVADNGSVGLGTVLPNATLHINRRISGTNTSSGLLIDGVTGSIESATLDMSVRRSTDGNQFASLDVYDSEQASGLPKNLILQPGGGKVGVGTTTPDATFEVHNPGPGADARFKTTSNRDLNIELEAGTNNNTFRLIVLDEADKMYISSDTTNPIMTFLDNGYVGIGTTNPDRTLHVAGTIKADAIEVANATIGNEFSSGQTHIDTGIKPTDFRLLEAVGWVNPNSQGSSHYKDIVNMHIYKGTGWNGTTVTDYVYAVMLAPPARTQYQSGGSQDDHIDVTWVDQNGVESDSCPVDSAAHQLRIKLNWSQSYTDAGINPSWYIKTTKKL